MRHHLIISVIVAFLLAPSAFGAKKQASGLSVEVGEQALKADKVALAAWLGYAGARIKWRQDHNLPIDPAHNIVVAGYQEELEGRRMLVDMWHTLKKSSPEAHDSYIELLDQVLKAGYLKEYVHTYLVPNPDWATAPPDSLSAFDAWRTEHLPGHTAQTVLNIK